MSEAVIEAKGLVKKYGQLEAVRGIDLEVKQGEIFGFLGPNGAGKSTTISMLCTLLKPTAGSASVAGIDVVHDPARVRQRIGLVFQDPSLDDQLTGRENLEFHAFIYSVPAEHRREPSDKGPWVAVGTPGQLKAMVGGGVVTMTSSKAEDAVEEIQKVLGVVPTRDDGTLRMEVPDGRKFVPRLVRELTAPVDTISLRRPSLDDVFLKLTGRAIREEEASDRERMRAMASRWMGRRR